MISNVRRAAVALLILAAAPAFVAAQEEPLPEAGALVARYVDAIGGRDAVLARKASRTVGRFEMPAAGLGGDLEVVTQAPNRMITKVTIEGMGVMRSGFDGSIGWSLDPMTGARLLEGKELAAMRDQANMLAGVRDSSLFASMETVERTEMGGEACYLVKLVWQSGRESHDCYSVESGLLVGSRSQQESPMGTMDVTVRVADYREFGGVRMPTRIVQEMMGMQQTMTISDVQFENVDVSVIDPPAEIKALQGAGS